jgi:hypothetical protein
VLGGARLATVTQLGPASRGILCLCFASGVLQACARCELVSPWPGIRVLTREARSYASSSRRCRAISVAIATWHKASDPRTYASIYQEVFLGLPGAFADIKVTVPGAAPYFVEVKYGYCPEKVVRHLERKFGAATPGGRDAARLVLVINSATSPDWPATELEIRRSIRPELELEIWDESMLLSLLRSQFGLSIDHLTEVVPTDLHAAIDRAQGWRPSGSHLSTIRCRLRSCGTSGRGFCGAFAESRVRLRGGCCPLASTRTSSSCSPI